MWPDMPGSLTIQVSKDELDTEGELASDLSSFGDFNITQTLVTLITEVADSTSGQDVTFVANWRSDTHSAQRSWQFHVDAKMNASFTREWGDDIPLFEMLPPAMMAAPPAGR